MYWFPKAFDLFDFPVDALWCTSFQRLLISSTGKPNKSKVFRN
jgi:hypothetical protein